MARPPLTNNKRYMEFLQEVEEIRPIVDEAKARAKFEIERAEKEVEERKLASIRRAIEDGLSKNAVCRAWGVTTGKDKKRLIEAACGEDVDGFVFEARDVRKTFEGTVQGTAKVTAKHVEGVGRGSKWLVTVDGELVNLDGDVVRFEHETVSMVADDIVDWVPDRSLPQEVRMKWFDAMVADMSDVFREAAQWDGR